MKLIQAPEGVIAAKTSRLPDLFPGLGKQQCQQYVAAMYLNPDFSDGVIKPTQKTTVVVVSRFLDYLRYMDEVKFK